MNSPLISGGNKISPVTITDSDDLIPDEDTSEALNEPTRDVLETIARAVSDVNHGTVIVQVHRGRVVYIDRTVRFHFPSGRK